MLDGGVVCQRHAPSTLPPGMRPCTHFKGGWVGPRAGLDIYGWTSLWNRNGIENVLQQAWLTGTFEKLRRYHMSRLVWSWHFLNCTIKKIAFECVRSSMFIAKMAHRIKLARGMVKVPATWKLLASPTSLVAVFYLSVTVFLGRTHAHACTHLWTPKWAEALRYWDQVTTAFSEFSENEDV